MGGPKKVYKFMIVIWYENLIDSDFLAIILV